MPISSPAAHQPARQHHVILARRRIAGRMIVEQHDRRGARRWPPPGTPRADARCSRRACRPTAPSSAGRDAWCRAGRRRTARPAGCRIAAAAAPRHRAGRRSAAARGGRAAACAGPASTAAISLRGARRADARHLPQVVVAPARARAGRRPTRAPRWRDRARSARGAPCPSTIASSSLSPSAAAPTRSSFSRGRSCGATGLHRTPSLLYFPARCVACGASALLLLVRCRLLRTPAERNRSGAGRDRYRARRRRGAVRRRRIRRGHTRRCRKRTMRSISATTARRCRCARRARARPGIRPPGRRRQGKARSAAEGRITRHHTPASSNSKRGSRPPTRPVRRTRSERQPGARWPTGSTFCKKRAQLRGRRLPAGRRRC